MFYSRITLNASGPFTMHRVSIFNEHNECIDMRFYWEIEECRDFAAHWANTLPYHIGPRFIVRRQHFTGLYSVEDMSQFGRSRLWNFGRKLIKEYRTEKYARRLCERLNYVNGMI